MPWQEDASLTVMGSNPGGSHLHWHETAEDPLEDGQPVEADGSDESGGFVEVARVHAEALLEAVADDVTGWPDRKDGGILLLVRLKKLTFPVTVRVLNVIRKEKRQIPHLLFLDAFSFVTHK